MRKRQWYRIQNAAKEDEATIYIYDVIDSFWGVSAQDLVRELAGLKASTIHVRINSPGGDVFDGIAIFNALRSHPATVTTRVDGIAASAASVIVQAGDRRVMLSSAQMMIHDAWGLSVGNAEDMRSFAEHLDRQSDVIAGIYAERSDGARDEFRSLMRAETWLTDVEAVALKLADEIVKPESNAKASAFNPRSPMGQRVMASLRGANPPKAREPEHKEAVVATDTEMVPKADLDAAVAEIDALKSELAELKPAQDVIDTASLPEAVVARLRQAEEVENRLAAVEQANRVETFVRKARDEFGDLAPADQLGVVLEAVDRVLPDEAKSLDDILKAVAARAETSLLFKELGSDGAPGSDDPAEAEIAKHVAAGLPRHDAIRKTFAEHPDWYPAAKPA